MSDIKNHPLYPAFVRWLSNAWSSEDERAMLWQCFLAGAQAARELQVRAESPSIRNYTD